MAIANPLLNFVVRGFQALFGIVVLGISVSLIRGHHWGGLPASLGFSAFVGGVTILGAVIGVAGLFFSFLDGMIGLIVDGAVAVINAAGGIVSASPSSAGPLRILQSDISADKDQGSRSQDLWCGLRWRPNIKEPGQAPSQRHLQWRLQSRRRVLVLLRGKRRQHHEIEVQVDPSRLRLHVPHRCCSRGDCLAGFLAHEEGLLDLE